MKTANPLTTAATNASARPALLSRELRRRLGSGIIELGTACSSCLKVDSVTGLGLSDLGNGEPGLHQEPVPGGDALAAGGHNDQRHSSNDPAYIDPGRVCFDGQHQGRLRDAHGFR